MLVSNTKLDFRATLSPLEFTANNEAIVEIACA